MRSHNASRMLRILTLLVVALAVAPGVLGHSWIEQLRNIDEEGNYVGEYGYPRGYVAKTDPDFGAGDGAGKGINHLANAGAFLTEKEAACHPNQVKPTQSAKKYPRLKASPGGFIAMRYSENGHVTEPVGPMEGKKSSAEGSGTVLVFGTTEPQEDETLFNVLQWTKDGKGGNGKGVLLAMSDYVDSRCYENNGTPEGIKRKQTTPNYMQGQISTGPGTSPLLCESDVQLPENAEVGKPYTFYWVWQWPTYPGIDPGLPKGKDEYYTTCIDVDVTSASVANAAGEHKFPTGQQDAMSKAVPEWASRTAKETNIFKNNMGPIFKNLPTPPASDGDSEPSKPDTPTESKAPEKTPQAPAETPSSSTPAVALPSEDATPTPSGPIIPTLTGRPGTAKPSPKPTATPPPSVTPEPTPSGTPSETPEETPQETPESTPEPTPTTSSKTSSKRTRRPTPKPTISAAPPEDENDDPVTVTDTVYVTVTAGDAATPSSAADDKRAITTSATPSPARVTLSASRSTLVTLKSSQQAPASTAPAPSGLPGFNMGGSAKFRGMFT